jgi:hypothetical protein
LPVTMRPRPAAWPTFDTAGVQDAMYLAALTSVPLN